MLSENDLRNVSAVVESILEDEANVMAERIADGVEMSLGLAQHGKPAAPSAEEIAVAVALVQGAGYTVTPPAAVAHLQAAEDDA